MSCTTERPVFVDQSLLALELDTKRDLTGATVTQIWYRKPNNQKGMWTANVSGTELHYIFQNGDIDVKGTWEFQTYVEIGGKRGYGEIVEIEFLANLNMCP